MFYSYTFMFSLLMSSVVIMLVYSRLFMLNFLLIFELMNLVFILAFNILFSDMKSVYILVIFILMLCDSIIGLILLTKNFRMQSHIMMNTTNNTTMW